MTDTSSPPSTDGPERTATGVTGPLGNLHKMSRTAGLGNNEYVAVNGFAVATILFGLASALVVFNPIFLIVPVVAMVLGVVALYQIRDSNGTQTGRGIAWVGIVLAIGAAALLGTSHIARIWGQREDKKQIADVITKFGNDVAARNYDAAYAMLSNRFTGWLPKGVFVERLNLMQNSPNYGPVKTMMWNGRAEFEVEPKTNSPIAVTVALITVENGTVDRQQMQFVKLNGEWKIDGIPTIFPPQVNLVGGPGSPAGSTPKSAPR